MSCIVGVILVNMVGVFSIGLQLKGKTTWLDKTKPNLLTVANTDLASKTVVVTEAFKRI